ncbi:DUF1876 domain-containing protein [Streptomyces monticola]|uniref:DUF1876 domain-containing protein n=1 Tax=Streptomyces monticola TaxID=2666263 RepID=A0ABW2JSL0_9ACTN
MSVRRRLHGGCLLCFHGFYDDAGVITMEAKQWTVQIYISEEGDDTHARAVLTAGDMTSISGRGEARRNPIDRPVPEIGDELAVSRALEDLAIRLHDVASDDIVQLTGPVQPSRPGSTGTAGSA